MSQAICWELKCPECGFEFHAFFSEDEPEEIKKEIKTCPCGCVMDIINEKGDEADA